MATSSSKSAVHYKSPWRCLCLSLLKSRNRYRARVKREQATVRKLQQQMNDLQREASRRAAPRRQPQPSSTEQKLPQPQWPNLPGHQFSAEMISLCCQLSLLTGFRAVPKVLRCIFDALNIPLRVPKRDVIRKWNCRNGVAILGQAPAAEDQVWMIDHSVQLGKKFVLVVLGITASKVPVGRALRREDMTPLAVLPTTSRSKEEVGRQLTELAKQIGTPLAVLSDGACELHQGAQQLKELGFTGIHLSDIKHKVANLLKKKLGGDERFKAYLMQLGKTTPLLQQTELEHLLPPRKKEKCRFMSLDRLIDWATMAEQQLAIAAGTNTPQAERLLEKLGWLKEFEADLRAWRECRRLIGVVLKYANEQGVFAGATEALRHQLAQCPTQSELSRFLVDEMLTCYQSNEDQLSALPQADIRLPCSTEVLESAFGAFKAIQRHHGQGTFTSLLACLPTLFDCCDPKKIRERFSRVTNCGLQQWLKASGLTNSTQSRRTEAFRQVRNNASKVTAISAA